MSEQSDEAVPFLGNTIQVSIVTDDLHTGIDQLTALGIGPFAVFDVTPENCTEQRYQGEPAAFSMLLALANVGNMMWEVVQPNFGPNIYQDFLDAGHKGLHHVGADINDVSYAERVDGLVSRGYREIMGGIAFRGDVPFGYYHNDDPAAPIVEIYEFPENFAPEPDEIYPAPAA